MSSIDLVPPASEPDQEPDVNPCTTIRIRPAALVAATLLATVVAVGAAQPALAARPPAPAPTTPDRGAAAVSPVSPVSPVQIARAVAAKARLDAKARRVPPAVSSWYVDDATGKTVVDVTGLPTPDVASFAADPDPAAVAVAVAPFAPRPVPLAASDLVGGQTITNSGVRCSVGFNVVAPGNKPMILTAGHCTKTAGTWSGVNRAAIGPVVTSVWPKNDYGTVSVADTAAWAARPQVLGGPLVLGVTAARVGAAVCRSGSTTGFRCGAVSATNVSVNYGNGNVVTGLTKTTACAEAGDSGGPFITPTGQAQGIASGGVGDCTKGGVTYFQPLLPVLNALRLKLYVSLPVPVGVPALTPRR